MTEYRLGLFCLMGLIAAVGAACSSESVTKSGSGVGGSPGVAVGNRGSNAKSSGNGAAAATTDGLQELTPDQATAAKDPANACQGWAAEPEGSPAVLEFVVDSTSSMAEKTPSTNGKSKWDVVQSVLPQALAELPASWAVGLTFYCRSAPNVANNCYRGIQDVPIATLNAQQEAALSTAIQNRQTCTYTPSQAAWTFGLQNIENEGSPNRYIVLMTDGVPTVNADGCTIGGGNIYVLPSEYDKFITTVAEQTTATGVKTFVVGVPGSEDPQGAPYDPMYELSRLAEAGQTAAAGCASVSGTSDGNTVNPRGVYCHFDMTQESDFAAALQSTIGAIADSVVSSCDYTVPPAPAGEVIDPAKTNFIYDDGQGNSYLVLNNPSSSCDRGWQFTDKTYQQIHVCQKTCDLLQSNPRASISLMFGCTDWTPVL